MPYLLVIPLQPSRFYLLSSLHTHWCPYNQTYIDSIFGCMHELLEPGNQETQSFEAVEAPPMASITGQRMMSVERLL